MARSAGLVQEGPAQTREPGEVVPVPERGQQVLIDPARAAAAGGGRGEVDEAVGGTTRRMISWRPCS